MVSMASGLGPITWALDQKPQKKVAAAGRRESFGHLEWPDPRGDKNLVSEEELGAFKIQAPYGSTPFLMQKLYCLVVTGTMDVYIFL